MLNATKRALVCNQQKSTNNVSVADDTMHSSAAPPHDDLRDRNSHTPRRPAAEMTGGIRTADPLKNTMHGVQRVQEAPHNAMPLVEYTEGGILTVGTHSGRKFAVVPFEGDGQQWEDEKDLLFAHAEQLDRVATWNAVQNVVNILHPERFPTGHPKNVGPVINKVGWVAFFHAHPTEAVHDVSFHASAFL